MDAAERIAAHQGLVLKLAKELSGRYRLRRFHEDLVAWGNEGLLEAHRKFDDTRGASFRTFAWYIVRGRMLDGCRSLGLTRRGRSGEIAADQAFTEHQLVELEDRESQPAADLSSLAGELDQMVTDAAAIFLLADEDAAARVPDDAESPEEIAERKSTASLVQRAVDSLDEEDREIIRASFFDGETLDQIAGRVGCSKSWASRMRSAALRKLRHKLIAAGGADP